MPLNDLARPVEIDVPFRSLTRPDLFPGAPMEDVGPAEERASVVQTEPMGSSGLRLGGDRRRARRPGDSSIPCGTLGHKLYFGPRSLAYMGQSGPAHPEDRDTEPYLAERGALGCPGDGREEHSLPPATPRSQ